MTGESYWWLETSNKTKESRHREQMHGDDYEEYVCMDVSADESLYEQNVTSGHQKHGAGSSG